MVESRRLRLCELGLVVGVAFLPATVYAMHIWWTGGTLPPDDGLAGLHRILHAALAIALLAYVLHRRGLTLRNLGLTARRSDIPWALLIVLFARLTTHAVGRIVAHPGVPPTGDRMDAGLISWMALAIVPGAAAEELIVRAFLMTEVAALTGSMGIAVLASVSVQTLYHLYQGLPAALMAAGMFFVSSVFYANLRRVTPLIVSHSLHNFWLLATHP